MFDESLKKSRIINCLHFLGCFVLVVPVFIDGFGVYKNSDQTGLGLPLSLIYVILLPLVIFLRVPRYPALIFFVCIFSWSFSCFLYSMLEGGEGVKLLIAYLAPLISGFVIFLLLRSFKGAGFWVFIKRSGIVIFFAAALWVLSQFEVFLNGGRANGDVFGLFSIYQVWVYWPTMLAVFFCLFSKFGLRFFWLRLIFFVGILFSGAREPLLQIVVFTFFFSILSGDLILLFRNLVLIAGLALIAFAIFVAYPDVVIYKKLIYVLEGHQSLDAGRLDVLGKFDFDAISFVYGTGFNDAAFFGSAHNQYLELYYRGGVISLLPLFFVVFLLVVRKVDVVCVSVIFALFFVSFNINVPLRSPYFSTFFWVFIFFLFDVVSWESKKNEANSSRYS